jgi:hypothetical protein
VSPDLISGQLAIAIFTIALSAAPHDCTGGPRMFAFLSEDPVWQLLIGKASGALPYAAFAGFLWNVARQGGWSDLVIRVVASMVILMIGWWVLLFGLFGLFAAAVGGGCVNC